VFEANEPEGVSVIGQRGGISGWFDRLRASAQAHLSLGPSDRVNEVLQGVVMGDTQGIDEGYMTAFRRSGTAHMLSVSGLHVASLAGIMIGLARLLGAARWVGFLLAAASALLMIPFVGASPPLCERRYDRALLLRGRWVGRGRGPMADIGYRDCGSCVNPLCVRCGFQLRLQLLDVELSDPSKTT
jgi:hypothetical protein